MAEETARSMDDSAPTISLTLHHHGKHDTFEFDAAATLADLAARVEQQLAIPLANQKLLVSPKPGLLKPPFAADVLLSSLADRKITLLGSTAAQVSSINKQIQTARAQFERRPGPVKPATPARTRDWKTLQDRTTYTFLDIKPLPYLPRPERSTAFLERLRDDPGIRAAMAKHKFTVPLLTEMNPAEHTTHESRTLGLNRNRGEVIELRLRTDAYDGYRDYRTIRNTLCHELAHNVHGEHDRHFWDLCKQIEREVEAADWTRGGRSVGDADIYTPAPSSSRAGGHDDDEVADHGGWTGGAHILGGGSSSDTNAGSSSASASASGNASPANRRDMIARAAEERRRRQREQRRDS